MTSFEDESITQVVVDETKLFIASNNASLDDFLKTDIATGKYIYCQFIKESINPLLKRLLIKRQVSSISFCDGYTLYPADEA